MGQLLHLIANQVLAIEADIEFGYERMVCEILRHFPQALAYGTLSPAERRRVVGDTVTLHAEAKWSPAAIGWVRHGRCSNSGSFRGPN